MTTTKTLYRIIVKATGSLQPGGSFWGRKVLYCGYDRLEAARIYHTSVVEDHDSGYGNPARRTVAQRKEISCD
jgi:hypothetical protein